MIVMGIDPGLATVGYGVIDSRGMEMQLVDYGTICTPAGMKLPERLDILYDSMLTLIDRFSPEEIAFEELFFSRNVTTGINVAQARGVLLAAAYKKLRRLFEYTPMQVKQAVVGYGHADKHQVQAMVKAILRLKAVPQPDDAADAVAIAICHAQTKDYTREFRI